MLDSQERIVAAVRVGASIDEASRDAGCAVATVRRWLTQGRKGGKHEAFARAVDDARAAQRVDLGDEPMSHDEVERILTDAIRRGRSLQAVKLWLQLHPQDGESPADDPFAEFDSEPS